MKRPLFFLVLFAVAGCSTAAQATVPRGVATPRYTIADIVTRDVPEGNLQVPYTIGFAAVGGTPPYRWSLSSGTLPPGLKLNADTGILDGVPTQLGSFSFTIRATGQTTPSAQAPTAKFTLNIVSIPTGPNLPQFPKRYVDTTMPTVDGTTLYATTCTGAAGIQAQINAAAALDGNLTHAVVITSTLSCNGAFILPVKSGSNPNGNGWILIKSSAAASLPAEGTRVDPAIHAQYMPKLLCPTINGQALYAVRKAHHYRFIGIEFGMAPGVINGSGIIDFGTLAGDYITTTADLPHHLIFDRGYIHGQNTVKARRCVQIEANHVGIIDSYLSNCHEVGADSQAIAGWNFEGPLKVVNNYLEGAGENLFFGGAGHVIAGVVPSDIEIRRNHFFKPLSWRIGNPSYAGIPWGIKNSFELKNAQRVLFEGNVLEHCWAHAQAGFMVQFTPRIECKGVAPACVPQAVVQDITFRYNRLIGAGGGISMVGRDSQFLPSHLPDQTNRIWIHDNLLEDISSAKWGGKGGIFLILYGITDLRIDHNTGFQSGPLMSVGEDPINTPCCPLYTSRNFIFQDNIFPIGTGLIGSGKAPGNPTLNFYFPGHTFLKNVLPGVNSANFPANNYYPGGPMPSNIGFVNFNNGIDGDYRLLSTSPYKNAGTNGKDLGARAGATQAAVTGVK